MNSNKLLLNGILAFSILSLSIAYFIQYALGHKPCNLCIIERIPYIVSIILISLIFILNKYQRIISSLILLFFVFGALVSFYHFGIEQGFFNESFICELNNSNSLNKDELLNQLKRQK
jgi:disulfide bond formation protein DsbB